MTDVFVETCLTNSKVLSLSLNTLREVTNNAPSCAWLGKAIV